MLPTAGEVTVAADEEEGLEVLGQGPKGWRMALWFGGEAPKAALADDLSTVTVRLGLAYERGLGKTARADLTVGRGNMPPVLDLIEGVVRLMRGVHTASVAPDPRNDTCFLMRFRGWAWQRFDLGVGHSVAVLTFSLDRQLQQRVPLFIRLNR